MIKRFKEGLFGIVFFNIWWIWTRCDQVWESPGWDLAANYALTMLIWAGVWHICDSVMYITTGRKS